MKLKILFFTSSCIFLFIFVFAFYQVRFQEPDRLSQWVMVGISFIWLLFWALVFLRKRDAS